jgi:hypothetical protein
MVSKVNIQAKTDLNPLIDTGDSTSRCVSADLMVAGAATSVDELVDQWTTDPIYANEQVSTSRLGVAN